MSDSLSLDAHCHLHWSNSKVSDMAQTEETLQDKKMSDMAQAGKTLQDKRVSDMDSFGAFINTVAPKEFEEAKHQIKETENIKIGLGLHPWYVEECDVREFQTYLPQTRFIGEIGLDFSKKFSVEEKETQVEVFETLCEMIAKTPYTGKTPQEQRVSDMVSCNNEKVSDMRIISVHTCKTHGKTHEILKQSGVIENSIVIYHWFGDDEVTLKEAIDDGCLFSVNARMLSSKKGLALAGKIPKEQLLFETDMPKAKDDVWTLQDSEQSIILTWQKLMKMENVTSK